MRRARVETAQIWGERYITQRRLNIPAFSSTFLSIFLLLLLFEDETLRRFGALAKSSARMRKKNCRVLGFIILIFSNKP